MNLLLPVGGKICVTFFLEKASSVRILVYSGPTQGQDVLINSICTICGLTSEDLILRDLKLEACISKSELGKI